MASTTTGSARVLPERHHCLVVTGDDPDLVRWSDNIRQLEALGAHGILAPADAEELAETYRTYRQRMHHLNLAGAPGLVPRAEAAALVATVVRHWRAVFYTDAPQSAE